MTGVLKQCEDTERRPYDNTGRDWDYAGQETQSDTRSYKKGMEQILS